MMRRCRTEELMVEVGSRRSINCFKCPLIAIEENFMVSQMVIIPNPRYHYRPRHVA
jgi:hypothetical protein